MNNKDIDDLFDGLESGSEDNFHEWLANKNVNEEHKLVNRVVSDLGLSKNVNVFAQNTWTGGDKNLTFSWFHSQFPSFPIRLSWSFVSNTSNIMAAELFTKFSKLEFYKKFVEMQDSFGDHEQYNSWAMFFKWTGLGLSVIHNSDYVSGENKFIKQLNNKHIYLETYNSFIDNLKLKWKP